LDSVNYRQLFDRLQPLPTEQEEDFDKSSKHCKKIKEAVSGTQSWPTFLHLLQEVHRHLKEQQQLSKQQWS
jgi:hypothetical protein